MSSNPSLSLSTLYLELCGYEGVKSQLSVMLSALKLVCGAVRQVIKSTRKLCYRKDDRAMRFCCAILISVWSSNKGIQSSDVNKGRGRCRAETTD